MKERLRACIKKGPTTLLIGVPKGENVGEAIFKEIMAVKFQS